MDETTLEKPKRRVDRPASRDPAAESLPREMALAFAGWARHTFSVASLLNGLKSLLWVAPLSVVIWIYADRELSPPPQSVLIPIQLRSPDPTRIVRLVDLPDNKVRADIYGSNAAVEFVLGQIESGAAVVQLDVPRPIVQQGPGKYTIASSHINDQSLFSQNAVTVSNVQPTDLTVDVDVLQEKEMEIQPAPDGKTFAVPPVFEPRKVRVRAPAAVFNSGNVIVYAHLDEAKEPIVPGPNDLTQVPLSLANGGGADVTITPPVVSAHVEVKKSDVTVTLDSIPIWAIYPPTVDDKFKAVYDQSLPSVVVTGPEDQIRALQAHTAQPIPKATFEVNALDLTPGVDHEARLHFELPPDVHVSPEFAQKTITYRLVERKSSD